MIVPFLFLFFFCFIKKLFKKKKENQIISSIIRITISPFFLFSFWFPLLEWKYLEVMYMGHMGSGIDFGSFSFKFYSIL